MKKFKSFIAVLLCLAAVFCTAGCSASKKSALNISGAQIDYETFLYYFDQVHAFPEKYELAADATNEQMIDAAIELCCEYVAVNTKLSEYGLTLSASEKRSASNNLEDLWHVFSGYYEKLGVSKQTLMKIETADTSRNRLFYYIYDEGGEKAVSEDDIKKYYNENYISFRAITGYLTTTDANGDIVVMTADQKAAMNKEFMELSTRLGNGQTIPRASLKRFSSSPSARTPCLSWTTIFSLFSERIPRRTRRSNTTTATATTASRACAGTSSRQ